MGIVVEIGGMSFPTKTAFIEHCQAILRKAEDNSEIVGEDATFVEAVLKARPEKVEEIGTRTATRYLRIKHRHNTSCFAAELDDGSLVHFSFMKFINAYPKPTGS
ncbi:MAG: DUF3223 domain-containing protein [Roseibium sp.]|uniref:DUF3223 domain-containing protein n=1 Tax=Roseibium sp. TaxID=1936156 RepID=UPI003D9C4759